jgi:programmed cell death protein 5
MPDDSEDLDELREKKMEEMQKRDSQEAAEEQAESRRQQIKQQAAKYLTKEARSRLGNVRAAQPDLASAVEMQIAQLGRAGRIDKMDDDELKEILRSIKNEESQNQSDIKFRR